MRNKTTSHLHAVLFSSILALAPGFAAAQTVADITDLILVTGQSNVTGSQTEFDPQIDTIDLRVFAYTDSNDWEAADLHQVWDVDGIRPGNGSLNPYCLADPNCIPSQPYNNFAFHFAKTVVENDPSRIVGIIIASAPGEGIQHWDANSTFSQIINTKVIAALNAQGVKSKLDGILWHQGETDHQFIGTSDIDVEQPAPITYYPDKLNSLIQRFRAENWFDFEKPFICGETKQAPVNARLMALNSDNDPWTGCVRGEDLPTREMDLTTTPPTLGTHFTAEGLRTLGQRYGLKYLEMVLSSSACDGTEDTTLLPGNTDSTEYGWRWGTNSNRDQVTTCFDNTGQDFILSATSYDIDFANEVEVFLNDSSIGSLSRGLNNQLNSSNTFAIPLSSQISGLNEIRFQQRTSGFVWGMTNLTIHSDNTGSCDATLTPDNIDPTQYGWRWGTDTNIDQVIACFDNTGQDFTLSTTGYDIDFSDEVQVFLNDSPIGFLSQGPNNNLNSPNTFSIPLSSQVSGNNEIRFQQRSSGFIWGITNLSIHSNGGCDTTLTSDNIDSTQYGWRWGTDTNRDQVIACFDNTGQDFTLITTGYDIDFSDEIQVFLNDTSIGFLSRGPNNTLNNLNTFSIPLSSQVSGNNEIRFQQRTSGFVWGVTDLELF